MSRAWLQFRLATLLGIVFLIGLATVQYQNYLWQNSRFDLVSDKISSNVATLRISGDRPYSMALEIQWDNKVIQHTIIPSHSNPYRVLFYEDGVQVLLPANTQKLFVEAMIPQQDVVFERILLQRSISNSREPPDERLLMMNADYRSTQDGKSHQLALFLLRNLNTRQEKPNDE